MRSLAFLAVVVLSAAAAYGEGNAPLAFQKRGKGARAVILVPGLDCGASVWEPTAKALAAAMKQGYDDMFKAAKDYAVDLVADSHHFIMYDQPARLQELLAADLAKLR